MISICLASRKRPEPFKEMYLSAIVMADNPSDIEFIVYRDDDDETEYHKSENIIYITGPRKNLVEMVNKCYKKASGDIFMHFCDDMVFKTAHWDTKAKKMFETYSPDKILLLCPDNSDWNRWGFGTTFFLHKNWVDVLGYFLPPYLGEGTDRWLNDVALLARRRLHDFDITTNHRNIKDKVHEEKKRLCRKNRWNQRYDEFYDKRVEESEKLRKFIDENNHILHS